MMKKSSISRTVVIHHYASFMMYRIQRKGLQDICKYHLELPLPSANLMPRIQVHFALSSVVLLPSLHLLPDMVSASVHSVVSTSVTSVTNKLESANNLANCEETQELGHDNSSSCHLRIADASDLLEHAGWI